MDYCADTDLKIKQHPDMFHMNVDSIMLGHFIKPKSTDVVLDVGTNNGVLLLYASLHNPKKLIGIDVFEEAIVLAKENMQQNNVSADLRVIPFQEFNERVDMIVCNPPYFTGKNRSDNRFLEVARHEVHLNLETLFSKSSKLLREKGRLCIIYPAYRLQEICDAATRYNFAVKALEFTHKKSKERVHSVCVRLVKSANIGVETVEFKEIP